MTVATRLLTCRDRPALLQSVGSLGLVAGLGAIVGLRWLATRAGADPLAVGAVFGFALAGLAVLGSLVAGASRVALLSGEHLRRAASQSIPVVLGMLVGLLLVGITIAGPALAGVAQVQGLSRPSAPFVPWAAITILVATAEELLLRGVLLDLVQRVSGTVVAILITSVVFALMHVPLYGWHVVPLDIAVGIVFAGLRLGTRTVATPAAAHAVADLATWWL